MCGIVAMFAQHGVVDVQRLHKATEALAHRGPDGRGCWMATHRRAALGHTRLSIVDLATGRQPIASEDGLQQIVVNGEFYGFEKIQADLEHRRHILRTRSDSEIALHLYQDLGVECLQRLRGEFAFVLWDESRQILFAARDRFGVKPLFYAEHGAQLWLASEVKALFAGGLPAAWDHEGVFQGLFAYQNPDRTLFRSVRQVPPGHYLTATAHDVKVTRYWDLDYPVSAGTQLAVKQNEACELLRHALEDAVRVRLRADVPACCFLSGGIDSSAIFGMSAAVSAQPLRAFTISFEEEAFDETPIARSTAEHIGAELTTVPVSSSRIADSFTEAVACAETMAVNWHGVARFLLSQQVQDAGFKVAISGEGGDEIFAGYAQFREDALPGNHNGTTRLAELTDLEQVLGFIPGWIRRVAVGRSAFHLMLSEDYSRQFSERNAWRIFLDSQDVAGQLAGRTPLRQAQYLWTRSILPNYSLFSERLEMAHGVETRPPLLDHKVFEIARQFPDALLITPSSEKHILRLAARPFVTEEVYARPKHPFLAPPIGSSPRHPLAILLRDVLHGRTLEEMPFFSAVAVRQTLDMLGTAPERVRNGLESALLMTACACVLQERFHL
jgi:asparagine synthase (glutamine-hydrolysing)